jgi:hypothetical protein
MNSDIYFKIIWRQRSLACSSFDWAQYNIVNTIPKFTTSDQQASSNICRESWLKLPNPTYFGNLTMRDWFDLYLRLQLEVSVSILLNVPGFRVLYILSFVRKALNMFEFCKCPYKGWDIVVFIIYKLRKGNPFEADEDLTTKITRMLTFLFSKIKIWTGNSQAWSFLRHLESVGTQESEKCKVHFARCTNFSVYCAMGLRVLHRSEVRETSHVTPLFRDVSLITGSTNGMARRQPRSCLLGETTLPWTTLWELYKNFASAYNTITFNPQTVYHPIQAILASFTIISCRSSG